MRARKAFKPSGAAGLFTTPLQRARDTALFQRLTPDWQDEGALMEGLGNAQIQAWLVVDAKIADRRRVVPGGVIKWQLRLAGGK